MRDSAAAASSRAAALHTRCDHNTIGACRLEQREDAHELLAQHRRQLVVQPRRVELAGAHDDNVPRSFAPPATPQKPHPPSTLCVCSRSTPGGPSRGDCAPGQLVELRQNTEPLRLPVLARGGILAQRSAGTSGQPQAHGPARQQAAGSLTLVGLHVSTRLVGQQRKHGYARMQC